MEINLSQQIINTVCVSLTDSKRELNKQLKNININNNKREILNEQLKEVECALSVFEELIER